MDLKSRSTDMVLPGIWKMLAISHLMQSMRSARASSSVEEAWPCSVIPPTSCRINSSQLPKILITEHGKEHIRETHLQHNVCKRFFQQIVRQQLANKRLREKDRYGEIYSRRRTSHSFPHERCYQPLMTLSFPKILPSKSAKQTERPHCDQI